MVADEDDMVADEDEDDMVADEDEDDMVADEDDMVADEDDMVADEDEADEDEDDMVVVEDEADVDVPMNLETTTTTSADRMPAPERDSAAELLITDLLTGAHTSSTDARPFVDILAHERLLHSHLAAPERFVAGQLGAISPMSCTVSYEPATDHDQFVARWAEMQNNENTTLMERRRYTAWLQMPHVLPKETEGTAWRLRAKADVEVLNTFTGRMIRLVGVIPGVYEGDHAVCGPFVTEGAAMTDAMPIFDAARYRRDRDAIKENDAVCVVFTDAGGEDVNDAVALGDGLVKLEGAPEPIPPGRSYLVFKDRALATSKIALFARPHRVLARSLHDLESVFPIGIEVLAIEERALQACRGTCVRDVLGAVSERFDVPWTSDVAEAVYAIVKRNVDALKVAGGIKQWRTTIASGSRTSGDDAQKDDQVSASAVMEAVMKSGYKAAVSTEDPQEPQSQPDAASLPSISARRLPFSDAKDVVVDLGKFGVVVNDGRVQRGVVWDPITRRIASREEAEKAFARRRGALVRRVQSSRADAFRSGPEVIAATLKRVGVQPAEKLDRDFSKMHQLVYSTEYKRVKKFNGDIVDAEFRADEDATAFTFEISVERGEENNTIEIDVVSFLTALLGASNRSLTSYADTARTLVQTFGERHVRNTLVRGGGTLARNTDKLVKPADFWISQETFEVLMAARKNNEALIRQELRRVVFYFVPAVVKCLVQLNELTVSAEPIKEQLKAVDALIVKRRPSSDVDMLPKINATVVTLMKFSSQIKGITHRTVAYIKNLVQFPAERYDLRNWTTYRPYSGIDDAGTRSDSRPIYKYIRYVHRVVQGLKLRRFVADQAMVLNQVFDEAVNADMGYHDAVVKTDKGKELATEYERHVHNARRRGTQDVAIAPLQAERGRRVTAIRESVVRFERAKSVHDAAERKSETANDVLRRFVKANAAMFSDDMRTFDALEDRGLGSLFESVEVTDDLKDMLLGVDRVTLRTGLMILVADRLNVMAKRTGLDRYVPVRDAALLDRLPVERAAMMGTYVLLWQCDAHPRIIPGVVATLKDLFAANKIDVDALDDSFDQMREQFNVTVYGGMNAMEREDREIYAALLNANLVEKVPAEEQRDDQDGEPVVDEDVPPANRDDDEFDEETARPARED
jgi:hypothetical protein